MKNKLLTAWVITGVFCTTLFGQAISLSGKVLDEEDIPLAQATVTLVKLNSAVTTDAQGSFKITATPIVVNDIAGEQCVFVAFGEGSCRVTSTQNNLLYIRVYDLKGALHTTIRDMLIAGKPRSYPVLSDTKSNGIFVVNFGIGNRNYTIKYSPGYLQQRQFVLSPAGTGVLSAGSNFQQRAWSDTLVIQKSGFVTQRWPVRNQADTVITRLVTPATDEAEKLMLKLVNDHRTGMGLKTLLWSDVAANYVRVHSRNISKGITAFGHDGFQQRVEAIAVKTVLWEPCENVVAGYGTAQAAFNGWLSSPGHKTNLENSTVNISGIGYYKGSGSYSNVYTQIFYYCVVNSIM